MPGPVRADGLFFACAKSKVKSTHKGKPPYGSPAPPDNGGGCTAVQHLTFFEKCAAGGTGMRGVRPRAGVLFVQRCSTLLFLRGVPQAAPGCGVSAPARRVPFRMHEKEPKVHIRGYPPYGTPGRVPAFGWAEGTRMSVPAPTCFLSRQALSLAPGRAAKPHYTVPDRTGAQGLPGRGTRGGVGDP